MKKILFFILPSHFDSNNPKKGLIEKKDTPYNKILKNFSEIVIMKNV